ncbi:MAG: PQQ-dependent sugar dehydrogenase [Bacteroidota bacterium]
MITKTCFTSSTFPVQWGPLLTISIWLGCLCWWQPSLAQPNGFSDQVYVGNFSQAVGLTFDANGRMYVFEKGGKVWIIEDGIKLPNPLIDLSEEVGNWRDFGLLGFALDPNFLSNGHIYLLYVVDRHHLLHFGTPNYNPNTNDYFDATIGRISRYTAQANTNYTTVDYNSRTVLVGQTPATGPPILHESHGTGALVFGTDGTLLASLGDGASYSSTDEGSAGETYYSQALTDGIISPEQNVGAYRCQLLSSLSGKVLRIDPSTGDGLPSNPFYQATNPGANSSKIWALGLRNPCRMTLRPETGSHNPADGNPGVFYIGDVGWGTREELNVMDGPGLNFGWPKYEGMTYQPGYDNVSYAPANHELAKLDWRNGTPRGSIDGTIYNVGSGQISGPSFQGNCSIGGVWYTGTDFPSAYQNTYFHADYGGEWIKQFRFDANDNPVAVQDFMTGTFGIVFVGTSPVDGALYYIGGAVGNSNPNLNAVHKIAFVGGNLPPLVVAKAEPLYGLVPYKGSAFATQAEANFHQQKQFYEPH